MYLFVPYIVFEVTIYECLYTYYPSCSMSDLCLYDTAQNFIFVVKLVFNRIVYI